jgi:AraC-like DNA-binding protein
VTPLSDLEQALGSASALVTVPAFDHEITTIGRWKHGDAEARMTSGDELIKIVVNLSNTQKVERLRHGVWTSKPFDICSFTLVPPDEDFCFSVKGEADVLQILLPQNVVAREVGAANCPMIRPRFQDHDPPIQRYALQILAAVQERRTIDDIRLAELVSGLGDLLAHDGQKQSSCIKGGLPPQRLRRVLDLISNSVSAPKVEALSLDQLAGVAELSPFHFARAFRETVGLSPCSYVLRRRLERARAMLAKSRLPVAAVGRQAGFRSHAHFSSQFRQQMGISPLSFRRAVHPDYDIAAFR